MKKKMLILLTSFWFTVVSASAQEEDSIVSILSRIQENVAELRGRTADFVCGEAVRKVQTTGLKINLIMQSTAQEPKNHQQTQKNIRFIPVVSDGKSARISSWSWEEVVAETADVKTIARTSASNKKLKEYNSLNGFDALFSWFDKENEKCFIFELLGSETTEERNVYKIRAKAKPDLKRAGKICESIRKDWNSTIWVDRETAQVVRLLIDPVKVNVPPIAALITKGTFFNVTRLDYAPMLVGKEAWWLPIAQYVKLYKKDKKNEHIFLESDTEYRDYKLFTSSVKIDFETPDFDSNQ